MRDWLLSSTHSQCTQSSRQDVGALENQHLALGELCRLHDRHFALHRVGEHQDMRRKSSLALALWSLARDANSYAAARRHARPVATQLKAVLIARLRQPRLLEARDGLEVLQEFDWSCRCAR